MASNYSFYFVNYATHRRYRNQNRRKVLKEFGLSAPEVAYAADDNAITKTHSENDATKLRKHHQHKKRRARSLQPETLDMKPEVSAVTNRGCSNFGTVSWQRLRPLPIPGADDVDRCRGPPEIHQPLLSSNSPVSPFDLSVAVPVRTVSHAIRESSFQPLLSATGSGRRRPNDVIDSSPTFRPQNARAWLFPPPPSFPPPLPPDNRSAAEEHRASANDRSESSSPYYFKLDPALTRRARRSCRTDRELGVALTDSVQSAVAPAQPHRLHQVRPASEHVLPADTGCCICDPDY